MPPELSQEQQQQQQQSTTQEQHEAPGLPAQSFVPPQQHQQQQQQWSWPQAPAEAAAQQAEWEAAGHGSQCRTYAMQDVVSADALAAAGRQWLGWRAQELPTPPQGSDSDAATVQAFNTYAAGLQEMGPTLVGFLLQHQETLRSMQQQLVGLHSKVQHLGEGVGVVVQQQQLLSGQQQLSIELQHKQLEGLDFLMANQVQLHRKVDSMQQHMGDLHLVASDLATNQARCAAAAASSRGHTGRQLPAQKHPRAELTQPQQQQRYAAAGPEIAPGAAANETTEQVVDQQFTAWPNAARTLKGRVASSCGALEEL